MRPDFARRLALAAVCIVSLSAVSARAEMINYPRATETPWYMPSEVSFGAGATDPTEEIELSPDVTGELMLQPVGNAQWLDFLRFRPTAGVNINLDGRTSFGYLGLNFDLLNFDHFYFDGFLGGAYNDGKTVGDPDHKALGGRFNFREAASLGYQFTPNWAVSTYIDHQSNAGLDKVNQGIETAGVRFSYLFSADAPTNEGGSSCCAGGYHPMY
jgi:hypothetical protein